ALTCAPAMFAAQHGGGHAGGGHSAGGGHASPTGHVSAPHAGAGVPHAPVAGAPRFVAPPPGVVRPLPVSSRVAPPGTTLLTGGPGNSSSVIIGFPRRPVRPIHPIFPVPPSRIIVVGAPFFGFGGFGLGFGFNPFWAPNCPLVWGYGSCYAPYPYY